MQYYGYSSGSTSSSIQPSTITINGYSCDIVSLTTANNGSAFSPRYYTACSIHYEHGSSSNISIHIGRNDTQQYFGTLLADGSDKEFTLFTSADVGKTIPVYIATTPPLCVNHATLSHLRWRHENTIRDATAKQLSDFNCRVFRKCLVACGPLFWSLRSRYGSSSNTRSRDKQNTAESRSYTRSKALYKGNGKLMGSSRSSNGYFSYRKFNWGNFYKYSRQYNDLWESSVLYNRDKRIIHLYLRLAVNCDLFKEVA